MSDLDPKKSEPKAQSTILVRATEPGYFGKPSPSYRDTGAEFEIAGAHEAGSWMVAVDPADQPAIDAQRKKVAAEKADRLAKAAKSKSEKA